MEEATNPAGVPVWSHDGILCVGNVLKASVRLTFPKGRRIEDPRHVFNSRLDSTAVRAIDVREGKTIADAALKAILVQAIRLNSAARRGTQRTPQPLQDGTPCAGSRSERTGAQTSSHVKDSGIRGGTSARR